MRRHRLSAVAVFGAMLLLATSLTAGDADLQRAESVQKEADVKPSDASADAKPAAVADEKPTAVEKPAAETTASDEARISAEITVEAKRLSEELIYSVNRTPETPFETSRAVQVITAEQIRRKAGFELSDIVLQEAGFFMSPAGNGGGSVIIRGLASRQVLVMIDGVKINNTIWRTFSDMKEHFNLLDPNEIERIEIVRGVVSVLGSEALGGVVNIITKKGPSGTDGFGSTLSLRYSSADQGRGASLQLHGQGPRYQYIAGVSGVETGDLKGAQGEEQANTSYGNRGGFVNLSYFPTSEKTLALGYRAFERKDAKLITYLNTGFFDHFDVDPMRMQMATLRYGDVTSRWWEDSLTATLSWNRQDDGRNYLLNNTTSQVHNRNSDDMLGLNLEAGKFIRSHHIVYGLDHTREKIDSSTWTVRPTGTTYGRGDYTDGGEYEATGVYLNDHFSFTKWLTITAGARYGKYTSRGHEVIPGFGEFDARSSKSNLTSSVNLVVHATPNLNFVGNYVRGYRAPNMHDMTAYTLNALAVIIPSTDVQAEKMRSMEGGFKYENGRLTTSAFYFRNNLSNLLVQAPGLYNGKNYLDLNGNGARNFGEPFVIVTTNIGESTVKGYEMDLRYQATANLSFWGNYTRTIGTNNDSGQSLSRIQPRLANVGVRLASNGGYRVWTEANLMYGSAYVGGNDVKYPGFHVYTIRGGARVTDYMNLTVGLENLRDEQYRFVPTFGTNDQPGRQIVVATEFNF